MNQSQWPDIVENMYLRLTEFTELHRNERYTDVGCPCGKEPGKGHFPNCMMDDMVKASDNALKEFRRVE